MRNLDESYNDNNNTLKIIARLDSDIESETHFPPQTLTTKQLLHFFKRI